MQNIKNIIFDLGGIFIDIHFNKTEEAFLQLGVRNFHELYNQHHASHLFELLETGKINADEFCRSFCETAKIKLSNRQVTEAWNAMLGDFPPEKLEWLQGIKHRYNIFLFSNTNKIHYDAFTEIYRKQTGMKSFDTYFIKAYYSHTLGFRKPYPGSFLMIMDEQHLLPGETLFIDDTLKNIEGAKQAGLQTIHLSPPAAVTGLNL